MPQKQVPFESEAREKVAPRRSNMKTHSTLAVLAARGSAACEAGRRQNRRIEIVPQPNVDELVGVPGVR